MPLADADRALVVDELGREPTRTEAALFENLWSEHCAYRFSRPLLRAFESDGERVVVGPGDDAAVVALPAPDGGESDTYVTLGIESHNHPSYVDPYDGAATGVGGIVRDSLSMGAYPVALADCLHFGPFDAEHSRYLLDGVVSGISDYANAIGVPTVAGSLDFHPGYEGNPLVNVACVGLLDADRLVTADATTPGNRLVLVGNATGRDGLGGAAFASEDLDEDAETADRPAVQVGDPYAGKLLIEASEELVERDLVAAARDLGAAGLGGATSEMVAAGGLGAEVRLDAVHSREPGMTAPEVLLSESQERMCYEVRPADVPDVRAVADRYDLGCSVVGTVTEGDYVCTDDGETVVDVPPSFLTDGAPTDERDRPTPEPPARDRPDVDLESAFEAVVSSPNAASKRWVYRQYDHEVGLRTAVPPGDDAAVLAIRRAVGEDPGGGDTGDGVGLAITAGAAPNWTAAAPYDGARAVAVENATDLASTGARPLAAVDCLNGGNPEDPDVYGRFAAAVDGLADACRRLDVPVVGGNVSLYNDSASGPVPPTPTVAMVGVSDGYDAPPAAASPSGDLLLVGDPGTDEGWALGGSEYLAQFGGSDRFPSLPDRPAAFVRTLAEVADRDATLTVHDVSDGGLAVSLAEMVTPDAGLAVTLPDADPGRLFGERPARALVQTTEPARIRDAFADVAPVAAVGEGTDDGRLDVTAGDRTLAYEAETIADLRDVLAPALD